MLPLKILLFFFSVKTALSTCHCENKKSGFQSGRRLYAVSKMGKLSTVVNESSGLALADSSGFYWTHNDQGKAALYKINSSGQVVDTLPLTGIKNNDWEELAKDNSQHLYIGDMGNNRNTRKNLAIYKVHPNTPRQSNQIAFRYSDQKDFPPAKKDRNFDCEAFFWHADSLYLFSKNRGNKQVKLYALPDKPGEYATEKQGDIFIKSQVTAADMNPSQTEMAVLTYGKIFIFEVKPGENLLTHPNLCIRLPRGQAEALVYVNDTDFVITNEKGKMFMVKRK
ncbi:hypothetical protein GXP67_10720 [Rhodocytophaga rosea]|uniref:Esterase-like activity of phytase family protein n=1 Tax=Rhodocytophaga rosea TaxID=2704465 RepID=A0A6C0GGK3_9BACT|nr:hypothetical protein [Rhodocytophaga rosea]QHT67087.1 hypothetical protein GXP67_10720 [Rhodocytophaga rosea]